MLERGLGMSPVLVSDKIFWPKAVQVSFPLTLPGYFHHWGGQGRNSRRSLMQKTHTRELAGSLTGLLTGSGSASFFTTA